MKNIGLILAVLCISWQVNGQYDPEAKRILDAMSNKYKSTGSFKVTFEQDIKDATGASLAEPLDGAIAVKDGMYKFDFQGQTIYNNGADIWRHDPELNEAYKLDEDPLDSEDIPLDRIYDLHKKGFKYSLISSAGGIRTIDLSPEDRSKTYHKIRMLIDGGNLLKKIIIYDKNATLVTTEIKSFRPLTVGKSYFTFSPSKYPNIEIID